MKTQAIQPVTLPNITAPSTQKKMPGFKENLIDAIKKVNDLQLEAHQAMEELATGKTNNIHETMIAVQKAEIAFKMMVQVRNKIMSAYQEVTRMPL